MKIDPIISKDTSVGFKREKITTISYSAYRRFKVCGLQGLFNLERKPNYVLHNPSGILGTVMHELRELASEGALQNFSEEQIENEFNKIIKTKEEEMLNNSVEAPFVPLAESSERFAVKKKLAIKDAQFNASIKKKNKKSLKKPNTSRELGAEIEIFSSDGLFNGIIDEAKKEGQSLILVDLKTGKITEKKDSGSVEIMETIKTQLSLYAALYLDKFGKFPDLLRVETPAGKREEFEPNQEKCLELMENVKAKLEEINNLLKSEATDEELIENFENPDDESCFFCGYRPICPKYKKEIWPKLDKKDRYDLDLFGKISKNKVSDNLRWLDLNDKDGDTFSIKLKNTKEFDHSDLRHLKKDDEVGIFYLKRDRRGFFKGVKRTRLYKYV